MRLVFFAAASCIVFAAAGTRAPAAPVPPPVPNVSTEGLVKLGTARPIVTQVENQPGPIHIDACFSDGRGSEGLTVVHHALRIANQGDRGVTAVRIRFTFYDAFDDVQSTRTNIATATINPGQTIDRINIAELSDSGPPARISCSVDAVRYADGTLARTAPGTPAMR